MRICFLQRPIQENLNLFFAGRGGGGGAKRRRSRRGQQKTDSDSRELACAKNRSKYNTEIKEEWPC